MNRERNVLRYLFLLIFLAGVTGLSGTAQASTGSVFFGGWYDDEIGRIGFDGSSPDPDMIDNDETIPLAMTVSGEYLYWESNASPLRIGRSRLDGTEVQSSFIQAGPGLVNADGLSVSDGRLYWTETNGPSGFGPSFLSSANPDGSGITTHLLSLGPHAAGPVVVAGGYVFFISMHYARGVDHTTIARVRLDGRGGMTKIALDRPLVPDTLVVKGRFLYWVESERDTYVARASFDGSSIDTRFRRVPNKGCHAGSEVRGGAISSRYYFLGCESGRIDRVAMRGKRGVRELRTRSKLGSGPVLTAMP